jgi:Na+-translocating ferredoxin:NAD+ oxidoreductase subunit B
MVTSPVITPLVAVIDEKSCIGCTLCVEACPVDAIVGAARLMHTVIAAECIGCKLCLPPCPVDCIVMTRTGSPLTREERRERAARARLRHASRNKRLRRERVERREPSRENAAERNKEAAIARAMQRARQRLQERNR